ncbi:MAG: GIY-YIG nuclease family protein [Firmicutes bacterium]|nr:GIY-YIG nuclease family protein [Bacillota bacterium]
MTNNLERRMYEHKNHILPGFTARYNLEKLVYCESSKEVRDAIEREKQLKRWSRQKKEALINSQNPKWNDLCVISAEAEKSPR